jgi:glycogen operon protein
MINAGDECFNTQYGNNNPYCQDNETGWTGWNNGETGESIREFVRKMIRFRNAHPVFSGLKPFKNTDYIGCGYPDLSLHGKEAWKPDLGHFSHAIGICLCENYVRGSQKTELIYLAINMHWETQELGLPKLAPGRRWNVLMDTALEDSFLQSELILDDQHVVEVAPRSIRILCTVTSNKPVRRRKKKSSKKDESKKAENKKAAEVTPVTVPAKDDAPVVQKTADVEKKEEEKNEE